MLHNYNCHIYSDQARVLGGHLPGLHREVRLRRQQPQDRGAGSSCRKLVWISSLPEQTFCYILAGERHTSHEQISAKQPLNVRFSPRFFQNCKIFSLFQGSWFACPPLRHARVSPAAAATSFQAVHTGLGV